MVDFQYKESYDSADLLQIIRLLRGPGGCPWDREQTHETIRRNFLEEAYEAVDAIDKGDSEGLCEELGDVLMQVMFHAVLAEESGRFTMADVTDGVCRKLIYRHPHVFGDVSARDSEEVLVNWEVLKRREKGQASTADAVDSVARALPALWRAEKMQGKVAKAGFDWSDISFALRKLEEEVGELREAAESGRSAEGPHGLREEVGDVLFVAAKVAQMEGVDPEDALHRACDKFGRRFRRVEEGAEAGSLSDLTYEQLVSLWKTAKAADRS